MFSKLSNIAVGSLKWYNHFGKLLAVVSTTLNMKVYVFAIKLQRLNNSTWVS